MPAPSPVRDLLAPGVRALLEPLLSGGSGGAVALDADGTLWRGDVGEDLLRLLVAEDRLPRFSGKRDLYAEYERRVTLDPAAGFAFAAAVLEGFEEATLLGLCRDFFRRRFDGRIFPFARWLVPALAAAGVDVWIVSASPLWPVIAGAEALGVPADRVIAVQCRVAEGRITGEVLTPVPTLEGKPLGLRARGVRPRVAGGNSLLDLPMLSAAEGAFVVAPVSEAGDLVQVARQRGWPIQWG